ncbi:MAG TPA: DUF61 family protein [Terriglobales bacterium]|nr:DUF61 family protein [Terriglobales bacterium]
MMFNSKTPLERTFDAILSRELRSLNTHLPKQRRTLSDLLRSKDPTIEAVDGSSILLKSSELEALAKEIPMEYHDRLKLPILILRRMELGKSIYTISGERIEEFTVQKILGKVDGDYHQMYKPEPIFLYRPEVSELLRRYHSLFVIGFGIPREPADYGPKRD